MIKGAPYVLLTKSLTLDPEHKLMEYGVNIRKDRMSGVLVTMVAECQLWL